MTGPFEYDIDNDYSILTQTITTTVPYEFTVEVLSPCSTITSSGPTTYNHFLKSGTQNMTISYTDFTRSDNVVCGTFSYEI